MSDEELLPCPFCLGEAEIQRRGSARQSMIIACTNCGCRMESGDVIGLTPNQRWAWNNREIARTKKASPTDPVAELLRHLAAIEAIGFEWIEKGFTHNTCLTDEQCDKVYEYFAKRTGGKP